MIVRSLRTVIAGLVGVILVGTLAITHLCCQTPSGSGGTGLLGMTTADQEQWTIRCWHSEMPGHQPQAANLLALLKKVNGLRADKFRLVSDMASSTIFYGSYNKVPERGTDRLVFPEQYHQDFALIRGLTLNRQTPFLLAMPERVNKPISQNPQWELANAKGTYTLKVAMFYNTPTFQEREEVAEQYVEQLRAEGIPAYFRHETARSFVYVGDFEQSDYVPRHDGPPFGPRVLQLIARHEEFNYLTENGYLRKQAVPGGQSVAPSAELIPVPRSKAAELDE